MHVSVVCTGNICRSPIGEHVLRDALTKAGLGDRVRVTSAGTGNWHVGGPADAASERVLRDAGYTWNHTAHQIDAAELATVDLALACDLGHFRALRRMTEDPDKVVLLRQFDPDADGDEVPDPYSGPDSEFLEVLRMIEAATPGIVDEIRRRLS
ncbi:low molecular weight phosphotyrosine protein phosphatase [Nakamurella silvestris]|nr:low molecular weight phosphotyrosine protein phosphatase [Nakamurella silvestris]